MRAINRQGLTAGFSVAAFALYIFGASAVSQTLKTNPLDARLKPYVDRMNERLPTMVAPSLRQERVSAFNGVLTYTYTELSRSRSELNAMDLSSTQRPYIFPAICKAPDTGRMLRDGVSFRYLYYGKDGHLAGQLSTAIEYEYRFEEAATQYGYTQRISFLSGVPRAGRA